MPVLTLYLYPSCTLSNPGVIPALKSRGIRGSISFYCPATSPKENGAWGVFCRGDQTQPAASGKAQHPPPPARTLPFSQLSTSHSDHRARVQLWEVRPAGVVTAPRLASSLRSRLPACTDCSLSCHLCSGCWNGSRDPLGAGLLPRWLAAHLSECSASSFLLPWNRNCKPTSPLHPTAGSGLLRLPCNHHCRAWVSVTGQHSSAGRQVLQGACGFVSEKETKILNAAHFRKVTCLGSCTEMPSVCLQTPS